MADLDFSQAVQYHYGKFPPNSIDLQRLVRALTGAAAEIARYDALMSSLHNSELLLAPLRQREAVISSRIEGTIATIDEVMRVDAHETGDKGRGQYRLEVLEVWSYTRALNRAQRLLNEGLPISGRLIKDAHRQLLLHGRGADKQPGEFKTEQNFVVDRNRKSVLFVPVSPDRFDLHFRTYEEFVNDDAQEALLQIALAHIEFEALHPFKDGNGRVGRMLITLMMWSRGLISAPHFYISSELERDKDQYIDRMRAVSANGEWTEWCLFFLHALQKQAIENIEKATQIIALYNEMKEPFRQILASQWTVVALDYIFSKPIFKNTVFISDTKIPKPSANRLSNALVEAGLLTVIQPASGRRSAVYAFEPLLQIVRV